MHDITKNMDSEPERGIKNNTSIDETTTNAAIPSVNLVSFFGMFMLIVSLIARGNLGFVTATVSLICAVYVLCRLARIYFFKTNDERTRGARKENL